MSTPNPTTKTKLTKPNRPCDRCRKRKSKCVFDDDQQKCYLCTFHNHECEFNMPAMKKKKSNESPPPIDSNNQNKIKSPSKVKEFYQNLYYVGGNNEFDDYIFNDLLLQREIELNPVNSIKRSIISRNKNDLFLQVEQQNEAYKLNLNEMTKIEELVGDCGLRLVSLYFRIVHTSFPVLSNKFLDDYKSNLKKISPCLLSCLYLFALSWWSFDSELSSQVPPSQADLEKVAEDNLYRELKHPTLATIQAGLLLIQYQSFRGGFDNPSDSWPMQCAIVGAAQALGLNRNCDDWDIPQWEKSLRKRLSWALFLQEKWLCLSIDQRSHISNDDWTITDLHETNDFQDVSNPDSTDESIEGRIDINIGKILFLQKIELSKVANDILETLYSVQAKDYINSLTEMDPVINLKAVLDYIKPLQIKLTEWESQLPTALIIELNITRGFISGAPNIYICNFMAQIAILRPVLRVLSHTREKQVVVSKQFMGIRDIVFTKCMAIFENILKFLNELKAEHLQTFWYTSARIGFSFIVVFGYLLTLTSKSQQEFDNCKDKLEEYVWKLKINNKNAEFFLHSILWWGQLKKLLNDKLAKMKFYNEDPTLKNSINPESVSTPSGISELAATSYQTLGLTQKQNQGQQLPGSDLQDRANMSNFLLPQLFNLDSLDNFIINYQQ